MRARELEPETLVKEIPIPRDKRECGEWSVVNTSRQILIHYTR